MLLTKNSRRYKNCNLTSRLCRFERKKARAKKRIKDIARDLIKLYAQRKSQAGYAYPVDTVWQREFEASFQYEDTVDQVRATAEVKYDMELRPK